MKVVRTKGIPPKPTRARAGFDKNGREQPHLREGVLLLEAGGRAGQRLGGDARSPQLGEQLHAQLRVIVLQGEGWRLWWRGGLGTVLVTSCFAVFAGALKRQAPDASALPSRLFSLSHAQLSYNRAKLLQDSVES
jgi:hypothetical protein